MITHNVGQKNVSLADDSLDDVAKIGLAFSNKKRVEMIKLIAQGVRTVTQLSKQLKMPTSNVLFHVQVLEDCGIIYTTHFSKTMMIAPTFDRVLISITDPKIVKFIDEREVEYSIPIGSYISVDYLADTINARDENGELELNIDNIYDSSRFKAQVLYARRGLFNYPLRSIETDEKLKCMYISFEACSEISAYDNTYKSDISVLINGQELVTYTCPGDFGGRKGNLNPDSYPSYYTQFGEMITIYVNEKGVYKNGVLVNDEIKISDIKLNNKNQNILSIGNLPKSNLQGGINLFGEKLGDYPQAIKVKYTFEKKKIK